MFSYISFLLKRLKSLTAERDKPNPAPQISPSLVLSNILPTPNPMRIVPLHKKNIATIKSVLFFMIVRSFVYTSLHICYRVPFFQDQE